MITKWTAQQELLLYIIHGVLHLVGYDDQTESLRQIMHQRETHYLRCAGIERSTSTIGTRQPGGDERMSREAST